MRFFGWLFPKPDPFVEAMKEKVQRADRQIEDGDAALKAAIHHTNGVYVRMERRTAVVKRGLGIIPLEESVDSIGRDIGKRFG